VLTAEIRWFFEKTTILDALEQRLEPLLHFSESSKRTDYYLIGAGARLGIKWREGNIEIKQQQADAKPYHQEALAGELEFWKKWSFKLENRDNYPDKLDTQHWVSISKHRKQALLKYNETQQTAVPLPSGSEAKNICEVEITRGLVDNDTYFTVGLEAFGYSASLRENLVATIDYLLKSGNLEGLDLSASYSSNYARWIQAKFNDHLPN